MKKLRKVILETSSPEQSLEVKSALKNSTSNRSNSVRKVFMTEEVMEILIEEQKKKKEIWKKGQKDQER